MLVWWASRLAVPVALPMAVDLLRAKAPVSLPPRLTFQRPVSGSCSTVWLLALALSAFAAREGFDLSWPLTGASGLAVSVLVVAALIYFQGSRATLTAFRDHMIDDARIIWKRWSVWILGAQATVLATWAAFSVAGLTPAMPDWLKAAILFVFTAAAITAMPFKQPNLPKDGA